MDLSGKAKLRQKAEELHILRASGKSLKTHEGDILKLLHELEVHQIELELSNEELLVARDECEILAKKYTALYDFAPTAYLIIDRQGTILELNFSASKIFGKERYLMVGVQLKQCIIGSDGSVYNTFLKDVFSSGIKQVCEVELIEKRNEPHVHCLLH